MRPLRAPLLAALLLAPLAFATAEDASVPAWGTPGSADLRPGGKLDFDAAGTTWCTAGYAFHVGAQGYLVTAGHCVSDSGMLRFRDAYANGLLVGRVVAWPEAREDPDIALILVTDPARVNATVLGWGGPRGVATDADLQPGALDRQLGLYGQNLTFALMGKRMRVGDLLDFDATEYRADTPVGKGDSGAPVLTQHGKLAVGVHVRTPTDALATDEGIRIDAAVAFFAREGYPDLRLALE